MTNDSGLSRLAQLNGIEPEYHDIWGKRHVVSDETKLALLSAMGLSARNEDDAEALLAECEASFRGRLMDPVQVVRENMTPIQVLLRIPIQSLRNSFRWIVIEEDGRRHSGFFVPEELEARTSTKDDHFVECAFSLDLTPGLGYHWVEIQESVDKGKETPLFGKMRLIVAPESCYTPSGLRAGARVWGPAIQLYALSSARNWGMGDFSDLKTMAEWCAEVGAGILGLNPLHSLFPAQPEHASPYSPSSRLFLHYLYLDIEAIPDFAECEEAKGAVQVPEFQARLAALRDTELVDYSEVAAVKGSILEMLFEHFREHHLKPNSERGQSFRAFQRVGGDELRAYGVFDALQEHFQKEHASGWGWQAWPKAYRDPRSRAVSEFASRHQERVEFFQYLQWQADSQLEAVGHLAMKRGLRVGLYGDLAVGADPGGFEAWYYQDLHALGARIGAPPDDFNPNGQDWGASPFIPRKLLEAAYAPFVAILRSNMHHAGALRIDHVMEFMRLFWVPQGKLPAEGAYVRYPFQDLLGVLALESQRNRCLVVGEDLGTVPDEVREGLSAAGVLSYRLLYFEKDADGRFKSPADYPEQALVAVSTHDLPTLKGYWVGHDLVVRTELNLYPTERLRETQIVTRSVDRVRLLFALEREGLLPEGVEVDVATLPEISWDLVTAVYSYLSRSPAKVLMFQMEDVLGQLEQANLPGTTREYPNWRRKLPTLLENFSQDAQLQSFTAVLRLERGPGTITPDAAARREALIPASPLVPIATYRLQFNKEFNFSKAAEIVPYLRQLGISHCYASPYLKARPGSTHGYDIVDHGTLNPELGAKEDFEHFVAKLSEHGMGQILDMVPNHMAAGCDNAWWLDILENGQASAYADFFDIAWHPHKEELRGKVLLPVLEDHYGLVLEKGLLQLLFDSETGEFSLGYHEHRFRIDPGTYPIILAHGLEKLEARLGAEEPWFLEFQSLTTAFENLPGHWETDHERVATRNRDKEVQKRQLARLCRECEQINAYIDENVVLFNGTTGEPEGFDSLHSLLKAQPYRLAYWRVASDDINYRRFFDVNELGGLRMENYEAFEETHRFVLDLIADGKIQGLRIDHIDGLYDPHQYCEWLRDEVKRTIGWEQDETEESGMEQVDFAGGHFLYLVVEKILATYENLPTDWPVQGTTGYDFANLVGGLFIDTSHERDMERIYKRFTGRTIDFDELLYDCKMLIMRVAMASELNVLANELNRIAESHRHTRDYTLNSLRHALAGVVACFPVYRTYVTGGHVAAEDQRYVDWAVAQAKKRSRAADTTVFDLIHKALLPVLAEEGSAYWKAVTEFAMRFQQFSGPVMAKGVEDTSFYIYNRLLSLNEVGGDPRRFGVSVAAFHHANKQRALQWPHAMLNTSTHDSKRSEDVRSRISVLSEIPSKWQKMVTRWSRLNRWKKRKIETEPAPSKNDEYALYQTLIGAWPAEDSENEGVTASFRQRIESYMIKAVREAKVHSSWINPNNQYEEAVVAFIRRILDTNTKMDNPFLQEFVPFQKCISRLGMFNSLSQVLLKLTAPGVPDIYQGNELWNFCLVDPDNRRPVSFDRSQNMLRQLESFTSVPDEKLAQQVLDLIQAPEDGRIKLYVTWKTLGLRWKYQDIFTDGEYIPLLAYGEKAQNLCAFARQHENMTVVVSAPRLYAGLCGLEPDVAPLGDEIWSDTCIEMPFGPVGAEYRNIFTGETLSAEAYEGQAVLPVARMFAFFPVALITPAQTV